MPNGGPGGPGPGGPGPHGGMGPHGGPGSRGPRGFNRPGGMNGFNMRGYAGASGVGYNYWRLGGPIRRNSGGYVNVNSSANLFSGWDRFKEPITLSLQRKKGILPGLKLMMIRPFSNVALKTRLDYYDKQLQHGSISDETYNARNLVAGIKYIKRSYDVGLDDKYYYFHNLFNFIKDTGMESYEKSALLIGESRLEELVGTDLWDGFKNYCNTNGLRV